jgi:hypothetical protein
MQGSNLIITRFHILDEVYIEKGTGIMEVTINQGFSISEDNLQWFNEMAWHIERGILPSHHVPTQGPHDYLKIAHAWLLTIKLLQRSHSCLHNSAVVCTTLPISDSSLNINRRTFRACVRTGFLCMSDKVLTYVFHSTSVTVCFKASFTSKTLATMKKFVANGIAPRLRRLNP